MYMRVVINLFNATMRQYSPLIILLFHCLIMKRNMEHGV